MRMVMDMYIQEYDIIDLDSNTDDNSHCSIPLSGI